MLLERSIVRLRVVLSSVSLLVPAVMGSENNASPAPAGPTDKVCVNGEFAAAPPDSLVVTFPYIFEDGM